jgi:hypothetical protein|tara:strand:+ start:508 stop:882 length:375 start_codon:yes stop_codon:yes gene_type:complete
MEEHPFPQDRGVNIKEILESLIEKMPENWSCVHPFGYDTLTFDDGYEKPDRDTLEAAINKARAELPTRFLREERNRRLLETDWTQGRDVVLSNDEEWKTYRQALRDLPTATVDPSNPTWPEIPI